MKNAGKACNNRLYRHIRTFEKIVKNYFVIYDNTDKAMRHHGLAGHLLQEVKQEAIKEHRDITLETHHKDNLPLYEQIGFHLMSTITHEEYDLTQYCMLLRTSEE